MGEDEIQLPCYPADQPAFKPAGDLAFIRMTADSLIHLHFDVIDTVLSLDSSLHIALFVIREEKSYPITRLIPVLELDKRTPFSTYDKLRLELIKAGYWKLRLVGCNDQQFDFILPLYGMMEVGYHAEEVRSRLGPQPPLPELQFPLSDSTIVATLEPQHPVYLTGTGKVVKDLRHHIELYEKVLVLYKPVEGSTFDDLFHFYSDVHCAIEGLRGPKEPDSTYRQMRRKYPMRIWQYPQD